jgi:ubiquinone/menaquinone biosynthesis C-methylase UbiE
MSTGRQEKIRIHYDSVADTYDHHYDHPRGRSYHNHLSRYLIEALPEEGDLLDIGCGTGLFMDKYIRHGGTAVGLDISRKMVERGRLRCTGCEFTIGTGEYLPFADAAFDAVASLLVFSYVRHPDVMLAETYRVLRPGGAVAICTLGKKLLTRGIPKLYRISEKLNVRHVVMKDFDEQYFNEEEMQELFENAGFSDVMTRWCSFAHIDMIDPIYNLATRIEPFVEKRVPQLAYNIFVSAKKPE